MAIQAWFYETTEEDPRKSHQYKPNRAVDKAQLDLIGVLQWNFNPDKDMEKVNILAQERKYVSRDVVDISKEKLENYEEKLNMFFKEHIHDDEEIRYILDGSGYFDVRDANDKWIRIHCKKGDLIILPAGIYHRFILDETNYIKAMRLFREDPKWTPIDRPCDDHERRIEYLRSLEVARSKLIDEDDEEEDAVNGCACCQQR